MKNLANTNAMVHKGVLVLYQLPPQLYNRFKTMKVTTEPLTMKEHEILRLLEKGLMYKEIAQAQGITIDTVKKHTKNIYRKLDARNRTEAVVKFKIL